jgi:hypothetical protein
MKQLNIDVELNRIYIIEEKIEIFRDLDLWQVEIAQEAIKEEDISSFPVEFCKLLKAIGTGVLVSHPN